MIRIRENPMIPAPYSFSWKLLGDITIGRPNLGNTTRLEVYRLMQFTLRDVLAKQFGVETTDQIFFQAGHLAGQQFFEHFIGKVNNLDEFVRKLTEALVEMGIGILRIEQADMTVGKLTMTVSEDLDCSGLPEMDEEICVYDEGFIAGLLESYTGKSFTVKEIDCWCTGDRTCRFQAEMNS